ncbi:MAG: caspase family protein [Bacteroidota bacterium]
MKKLLGCLLVLALCMPAISQELAPKENKTISGLGEYVRQAAFSPFRNYFVLTIGNNTLQIYDRDWNRIFEHQGNPKAVGGVFAFSPDEKYLAYGRYKGNNDIAIIRLQDLKVVQVLDRHTDYISDLEFSHDGNFLASASSDKTMILWHMKDELFYYNQTFSGFESYVNEASFSYDDNFLVTGDDRGNILVARRDGPAYQEMQRMAFRKHAVETVAFHPKREEFITGSSYGLRRYKLEKKQFVLSDSIEESANVRYPVYFSPDGNYLAIANYTEIQVFRVEESAFIPSDAIFRHMDNVFGASFSDDGQFLVSFSSDQSTIIWEIENVRPSEKSMVASWLKTDLTAAQRKALTPGVTSCIVASADPVLTANRDEFETTAKYQERTDRLADWALSVLQEEMEKIYGIRRDGESVLIPVQGLIGYNADKEIYKVLLMETEAGILIPVEPAKAFKDKWEKAWIRARKVKEAGKTSFTYSDFRLVHPTDGRTYELSPVENPFHNRQEDRAARNAAPVQSTAVPASGDEKGTTYALMFATNVYDYFGDLLNPVLDAQTIAAELSENYGVVTEVVLNPTLDETVKRIRDFASKSYGPRDNLMVFFAGHGIYDEVFREGYVISRDSRMDDVAKTSYLSHSNLRTMINNISCPHIFLVMDVCFGGTFDPHLSTSAHRGAGLYADISTDEYVERKMKYKTRLYLTSGGKEYVPDGRPGFHSPFARRFIEAIREYGGTDGVLTTAEILQFVEKVDPQPRFGEFGDNEPGSDFILVLKK